ncbi:MAG: hypothetical protein K2K45_05155 [Muribaculaceae bacterium]|nr:hypothetical protein [Muribaculaceae bacterium]
MFEFDWINLLQTIGGIIAGGGIVAFTKSGRIKAKADAMKVMSDGYEERIKSLHAINDAHNANEVKLTERIAQLDRTIDDKTAQIRNLTEKCFKSEQEVNRVQDLLNDSKDEIIRLTEERDREKANNEYNKQWRCIKSVCRDPEGRIPPNPKLATQEYVDPEKKE